MFVPIYDHNKLDHVPLQFVTIGLIVVNVLIFVVFQSGLIGGQGEAIAFTYGMIPAVVMDIRDLPPEYAVFSDTWEPITLITYQFLHGGWMHLIGNMAFLWVFGDNIEDALGHFKFLIFYLLCGVAAGLCQILIEPGSQAPVIGASGAVAGIIGAYLMLHPKVKVWVLVMMRIPIRLSAMWVLGFWIGFQIFMAFAFPDEAVAWWAHIGGFIAGALLVIPLKRRGVLLFDRGMRT
ncbi:MAG: rhomboid family intramembrane serine protease [Pseudomonadota bacterium]